MSFLIYPTPKLMPIQGLTGFGGGATGLQYTGGVDVDYVTDGLLFDLDFGRLGGSNRTIADGTDLATTLRHDTISAWTSNSTTTPIDVDGGSFDYKSTNGGHMDTNTNDCRVLIGLGSGTNISDTLNACTSMCVEGWYQYGGAGRDVAVSRFGSGSYGNNQFNHIFDPGGQFHYNSSGAGLGGGNQDWDAFGDNVWFHCIWQFGSNQHRWWVNNSEVGTVSATGNLGMSDESRFSIASRTDDYERLQGKVAIVRVYNKVLSSSEISQNYNAEKDRFGL
jgi:hypothetical protein